MKILVAEDDLDNARLLESILKKNAHTVWKWWVMVKKPSRG